MNKEAIARVSDRFDELREGNDDDAESLTTRQGVGNGRDQWVPRECLFQLAAHAELRLAFLQCHVDLLQIRPLSASPKTNHGP